MLRVPGWLALTPFLVCSACAIHPLPEDSTALSTFQITRQITCETRAAIIDAILGFLNDRRNQDEHVIGGHRFANVDANSFAVGQKFLKTDANMKDFKPAALSGASKYIVGLIWNTGIAYNYDLEMTEVNNNDLTINLLQAFTHSTFGIGLSTKTDLQRQNTRVFTSTATFGDLVSGPAASICTPEYLVDRNYLYPIAGHIGIEPVIQDFTQQAVFGNLNGDATKDFSKPSNPVQLAEQLTFTTTLELSVTPKVTFTPAPLAGSGFHVADANFGSVAQRKDVHKLTLGLFVPTAYSVANLRGGVLANLYGIPTAGIVAAPAPTSGEQGALDVLNQLLVLKIFRRDQ